MGVYAGGFTKPDIAAVSKRMQPIVNSWFNATISLIDPKIKSGEYNVWTNSTDDRDPITIWTGPARIQPIRIPFMVNQDYDVTVTKSLRIQIPLEVDFDRTVLANDGTRIKVVDGGMFPDAEHGLYVITTWIQTSYAWNRTFEVTMDQSAVID